MKCIGTGRDVYTHTVRLIVKEDHIYRYPDPMVTCAEETDHYAVAHPSLIIEVLTPSTERADRNQKPKEYTLRPSLDCYLLVSTDEAVGDCYHRKSDGGWRYNFNTGLSEAVKLEKVKGVVLKLAAVYQDVSFPKEG